MTYEKFISSVSAFLEKSGTKARFEIDREFGRYIARCTGGVLIIGSSSSKNLTVRCGSHQYMIAA